MPEGPVTPEVKTPVRTTETPKALPDVGGQRFVPGLEHGLEAALSTNKPPLKEEPYMPIPPASETRRVAEAEEDILAGLKGNKAMVERASMISDPGQSTEIDTSRKEFNPSKIMPIKGGAIDNGDDGDLFADLVGNVRDGGVPLPDSPPPREEGPREPPPQRGDDRRAGELNDLKRQRADILQGRSEWTLSDEEIDALQKIEERIDELAHNKGGHEKAHDVDKADYEAVSHEIGRLRKERVGIINKATRRTIAQFEEEYRLEQARKDKEALLRGREEGTLRGDDAEKLARINEEIRDAETKAAELTEPGGNNWESYKRRYIEERRAEREKRRAQQALRRAKAEADGVKFEEEDIPPFDESQIEIVVPKHLDPDQINYKVEERREKDRVEGEIEDLALLNEEKMEYLASPEYGLQIAEKITYWEAERRAGRYETINWDELNQAYDDQRIHTEAVRIRGLRVPVLGRRTYQEPGEKGEVARRINILEINRTGVSVENLIDQFTTGVELGEKFWQDAEVYFKQARRTGILREMDQVLSIVYREVMSGVRQGLSGTDIMQGNETSRGAEYQIERAKASVQKIFTARLATDTNMAVLAKTVEGDDGNRRLDIDPKTGKLVGIWDLYAELATRRLWAAIAGGDEYYGKEAHREYLNNEFNIDKVPYIETQERFWRVSEVGYLQIYAKTPEEYRIAADTYITDAQARTSDPAEVFQDVTQFLKQLTQSSGHQSVQFKFKLRESLIDSLMQVGKSEEAAIEEADKADYDKMTSNFLKELTTQMQARGGAVIADHSNELYHGSQYKQGMDFMAKDGEGPARWLSLMEIEGVAEALWKMDNDPRFAMLFEPYGSNGQLASDTVAQRSGDGVTGLHWQVEHLLVRELLGTRLANEGNRKNLAKDMPEKQFVGYFDGLYEHGKIPPGGFQGDGNIKIYTQYGELSAQDILIKVPKELQETYRLGRIQYLLRPENAEGGGGGLGHHDLNAEETKILNRAENKALKAVHIAMEIYGALGEKSKRGGGVVRVWRQRRDPRTGEVKEYFDFVPIHEGEKFVQFAETMEEMRWADDAEIWKNGIPDKLKNDRIGKEIIRYNRLNKHPDLKNFKARYRAGMVAQARYKALDEFAGEEMLIEDGKVTRPLTPKERELRATPIKDLRPEERDLLYGIPGVREGINVIRRGGKGFQARLYEYDGNGNKINNGEPMRVNRPLDIFNPVTGEESGGNKGDFIGYDRNGREVRLNFDSQGAIVGVEEFDEDGKAVLFDRADRRDKNRRLINSHLTRQTRIEVKKVPVLDEKGKTRFKSVLVEKAEVDFALATHHFYGDWTSHTYWSYQEEDRHMLLSPTSFAEARQIREGTLRPEHASVWARQLLLLDPTLLRVLRFEATKQEDHERKLTAAIVEHKYQSHWRISREVHRAFFPTLAVPTEYNGFYYGLQDFGGYRKMLESMRAQIGEDIERFARRGKRLLPDLHVPYAAASEMWGVGSKGIMGVMRLLSAPGYKVVGTMALDKFSAQSDVANKMRSALIESRNSNGGYEESLLLKPTNNSDQVSSGMIGNIPRDFNFLKERVKPIYRRIDWLKGGQGRNAAILRNQSDFAYAVIKSLGRYDTYMKLFPLMETAIRNSPGAFWWTQDEKSATDIFIDAKMTSELENKIQMIPVRVEGEEWNATQLREFSKQAKEVDLLLERTFGPKLNVADIDQASSPSTGSGRHSSQIFHDTFGAFLVDQSFWGGGRLYGGERLVYSRIYDSWLEADENGAPKPSRQTIWDFVLSKLVPT